VRKKDRWKPAGRRQQTQAHRYKGKSIPTTGTYSSTASSEMMSGMGEGITG
jgi:hypothetical protein